MLYYLRISKLLFIKRIPLTAVVLGAFFLFTLNSCSIQKRHYRSGFTIQWRKNPEPLHRPERQVLATTKPVHASAQQDLKPTSTIEILSASASEKPTFSPQTKITKSFKVLQQATNQVSSEKKSVQKGKDKIKRFFPAMADCGGAAPESSPYMSVLCGIVFCATIFTSAVIPVTAIGSIIVGPVFAVVGLIQSDNPVSRFFAWMATIFWILAFVLFFLIVAGMV